MCLALTSLGESAVQHSRRAAAHHATCQHNAFAISENPLQAQDKLIAALLNATLATYPSGFWLQIGSNIMDFDSPKPITDQYDPFSAYLRQFTSYHKCFVEAVPDLYKQKEKNVAVLPNTTPIHAAILPANGPDKDVIMYCYPPEDWIDWRAGCCSLDKQKVEDEIGDSSRKAFEYPVQGISLSSLLSRNFLNQSNVRIMLVCTEGFDYKIMKQFLQQPQHFRPSIIYFEAAYMSQQKQAEISDQLHQACYVTLASNDADANIMAIKAFDF